VPSGTAAPTYIHATYIIPSTSYPPLPWTSLSLQPFSPSKVYLFLEPEDAGDGRKEKGDNHNRAPCDISVSHRGTRRRRRRKRKKKNHKNKSPQAQTRLLCSYRLRIQTERERERGRNQATRTHTHTHTHNHNTYIHTLHTHTPPHFLTNTPPPFKTRDSSSCLPRLHRKETCSSFGFGSDPDRVSFDNLSALI
jgi:hypothetical protein